MTWLKAISAYRVKNYPRKSLTLKADKLSQERWGTCLMVQIMNLLLKPEQDDSSLQVYLDFFS